MNRGFTLIEVMVSFIIMIILGGAIASFFIFQMKTFTHSINAVEIQYQGQTGVNELSKYIMKAKKIIEIKNGNQNIYNYQNETKVTDAVFLLNTGRYLIIKHTTNAAGIKVLRINTNGKWKSSPANAEFIDYIEDLLMDPGAETFGNCNSIKLTMLFRKGKENIRISNQVYFRNANK